jgi:hypothetical protein
MVVLLFSAHCICVLCNILIAVLLRALGTKNELTHRITL